MQIELNKIKLNEDENPRGEVDRGDLEELQESFKTIVSEEDGSRALLHPIQLVKIDQKNKSYKINSGFRRFIAMKNLYEEDPEKYEWAKTIEAEILGDNEEIDNTEFRVRGLIENLQRKDMPPIQEAKAIRKLMYGGSGKSQTEIAQELGKSKGWVSQRLSLLDFDEEVTESIEEGDISVTHARELDRIEDKEARKEKLENVIENDVSATDLKEDVDQHLSSEKPAKKEDSQSESSNENSTEDTEENFDEEISVDGDIVVSKDKFSQLVNGNKNMCDAFERKGYEDKNKQTMKNYYFHKGILFMLVWLQSDKIDEEPPLQADGLKKYLDKDAFELYAMLNKNE